MSLSPNIGRCVIWNQHYENKSSQTHKEKARTVPGDGRSITPAHTAGAVPSPGPVHAVCPHPARKHPRKLFVMKLCGAVRVMDLRACGAGQNSQTTCDSPCTPVIDIRGPGSEPGTYSVGETRTVR